MSLAEGCVIDSCREEVLQCWAIWLLNGPRASVVVLFTKKDRSICFCVDSTKCCGLNKVALSGVYARPRIDDALDLSCFARLI